MLQRLERYELDVFAEDETEMKVERAAAVGGKDRLSIEDQALSKAAARATRRRLAAQTSLFDLANQKVVDELRTADLENMSSEDAKALIAELQKKLV